MTSRVLRIVKKRSFSSLTQYHSIHSRLQVQKTKKKWLNTKQRVENYEVTAKLFKTILNWRKSIDYCFLKPSVWYMYREEIQKMFVKQIELKQD